MERQAKEEAKQKADELEKKIAARKQEKKPKGKQPKIPDVKSAVPQPKAQRNFTDPDSRIMKDGESGGFEQAYNARIALDDKAQVSADSGCFSETNITNEEVKDLDLYIPPDRQKRGKAKKKSRGKKPKNLSTADKMRRKLGTKTGEEIYRYAFLNVRISKKQS